MCLQGSAFYLSGAGLVIVGWTIIGLCVEAYGFWLLFCEFLPTVLQFSRRVPFMSKVLDMPFLKVVSKQGAQQLLTHAFRACAPQPEIHSMRGCHSSCSRVAQRCC